MCKDPRAVGLRIVKKRKDFQMNYVSSFTAEEKEIIKRYANDIMQTSYRGSVVSVVKHKNNNMLLFFGKDKYLLNEIYYSEIVVNII